MSLVQRQERNFRFLDKAHLLKLRTKAMRSGMWFKALQRIDRVLVNLTIKVASNVRSSTLAKSILTVARKLQELLENKFTQAIRKIGIPVAHRLGMLAQKWGNKSAQEWASNIGFAQYLTIMELNGHPLAVMCGMK